jgi:hypothetical protein
MVVGGWRAAVVELLGTLLDVVVGDGGAAPCGLLLLLLLLLPPHAPRASTATAGRNQTDRGVMVRKA